MIRNLRMEKQFDSLDTYIALAKKTISKFAPKFYNGLAADMLSNEDAISDIAFALMQADWKFDGERVGKTGLKKTQYSYRNQCVIWAIKTYVTHKYKRKVKSSLDHEIGDKDTLSQTIADDRIMDPLDTIIQHEERENLKQNVADLLDSDILNDKQRQQIKMYYYDNKTLSQIGCHFGVSREAIRQNIKRGIHNIRKLEKCYS